MDKFTFAIVTYNHENYILECLESIKYQVLHYGRGIDVSVIISDDSSKDNTRFLVKKWFKQNREYFAELVLLEAERNQGILKNVRKLMDAVSTDLFKIMSGDDLLALDDVIHLMEYRSPNTLAVTIPVFLEERTISIEAFWFAKQFYYMRKKRSHDYDLHKQECGNYFFTPTLGEHKSLYDLYFKGTCTKYNYFDDDPKYHTIIKNNKDLSVEFVDLMTVIYRKNPHSITRAKKTEFEIRFTSELMDFKREIMHEEKNVGVKLKLFLQIHAPKKTYLNVLAYYGKAERILFTALCKWNKQYREAYLHNLEKVAILQKQYNVFSDTAKERRIAWLKELEDESESV